MSSDRIHRAAKDGLLDVLREATRSEANAKDIDGMTPVLWAAFEGHFDALKLLVARGGDPDKADQFGNTALHLASAKGHMQCVDFLVQFGVNIYALDIDHHSAQDLAAINNRDKILRYLDAAAATLEATDRKRAHEFREQAKKKSEKRAREFASRQQKLERRDQDTTIRIRPHRPSNMLQALKHKLWSGSQGNLAQPRIVNEASSHQPTAVNPASTTKFSALVGGGTMLRAGGGGAVKKRADAMKIRQQMENGDFKIGEMEANGKRSVRSIQGLRRDSEILYVGTYSSNDDSNASERRGKLKDVFDVDPADGRENDDADEDSGSGTSGGGGKFGTISRSLSQPDFLAAPTTDELTEDVLLQRPSGLFNRPSFGQLAFPRSVSNVLAQLGNEQSSTSASSDGSIKAKPAAASKGAIKPRSQLVISDSESDMDSSENEENDSLAILRFLSAFKLEDYYPVFQKNDIDMPTLMLLTENDVKSLGLPLGPYRRLCNAIQERREALTSPGQSISDSRL
ncbi:Usher syndrome type-1G protein homolog [Anopheles stephensi]|uniref:Usher syndrome type-1G protein homolog n=1 Tax=Anopheles stephensi TaxID=30069 RepID=UPI0007D3DEA9|nr:Usher syndrome type-1G protein homolog [Anopheles stephensi]XP_035916785.1 Usher syndrome type-1G protein homolog [Anopheles stephensi]XP_035916786.1 Usher syndrome type-1G protein homolog [Anopheles stephensi]XP_035916787.1 Usher syndrome type-1G protein homolog [Anopheles stephensi]XP_035916788.1 Usher syndrome type-1G protein homolog [Anopheles stephensi]